MNDTVSFVEHKAHNPLFTLAASIRKYNVTVRRPAVCLSHWHTHRDSPGAACDAASVHFGTRIRRIDILVRFVVDSLYNMCNKSTADSQQIEQVECALKIAVWVARAISVGLLKKQQNFFFGRTA